MHGEGSAQERVGSLEEVELKSPEEFLIRRRSDEEQGKEKRQVREEAGVPFPTRILYKFRNHHQHRDLVQHLSPAGKCSMEQDASDTHG